MVKRRHPKRIFPVRAGLLVESPFRRAKSQLYKEIGMSNDATLTAYNPAATVITRSSGETISLASVRA